VSAVIIFSHWHPLCTSTACGSPGISAVMPTGLLPLMHPTFSFIHTPDAIFSGPKDPGQRPQTLGTRDPNWHAPCVYVRSTCASNHLTGILTFPTMEFLCMVDGTFVLAACILFHSVIHQKSLLYCRKGYRMASLISLNMCMIFDP